MPFPTTLPIARYRFDFRLQDDLRLPEYAGSLLRGQFGAALRRLSCMTGENSCPACPLWRTCPYPAIFETPPPKNGHAMQSFSQIPNPYIVEAPPFGTKHYRAGELFSFHLVLVGDVLNQLALIVYAFDRAFSQGITKQQVRGILDHVFIMNENGDELSIWDAEENRFIDHEAKIQRPLFPTVESITLHFETPLRMQEQGKLLHIQFLTPRKLIAQIVRRISLLLEFHANIPPTGEESAVVYSANALREEKNLRWQEWTRYSSRQQQEMPFSGAVGDWVLTGDLSKILPYIWLGQFLHVGKNASFGLGQYQMKIIEEKQ